MWTLAPGGTKSLTRGMSRGEALSPWTSTAQEANGGEPDKREHLSEAVGGCHRL